MNDSISALIMELETIDHERADGLVGAEMTAQRLAEVGERCFRLSTLIRHGDA